MRVSVVVPCFNAEGSIAETIESILAQTRPADEVVIADDCSTDGSRDVIARYPSVRLVRQPRNSGCASSRNLAIRASTGDVIAIIDADDIWYPEHLATSTPLLERFPQCGFVFSSIRRFGSYEEIDAPSFYEEIDAPSFAIGEPLHLLDELLPGNRIPQLTVVFRRALYDECLGFDESLRYCEDYDLWLQFALRTCALFTGRITAGYRMHEGQLNQHLPQMFASTWYARLKLLDTVRRTDPGRADQVQQALSNVWVNGLYTAWAVRSRESLDYMLSLSDRFPTQRAAERQWRLRRRLWPALVGADRVFGALPAGLRKALRPSWGPSGNRPARI